MTLALRYAVRSDVGLLREGNEDSAYAGPHLLAVADGMGGYEAGEVASADVINTVSKLDRSDLLESELVPALTEAIGAAKDALRHRVESDPTVGSMGTTLTAILWSNGTGSAAVCHIGDSRAYLLRGDDLYQITRDHTFVQALVDQGRIRPEEAATHPQRSLLLRALDGRGDSDPDISLITAYEGDRYLLCSDGLPVVVSDDQILNALADVAEPADAVIRLIELAIAGGGPDNITCVIADVVESAGGNRMLNRAPVLAGAVAASISAPATIDNSTRPLGRLAIEPDRDLTMIRPGQGTTGNWSPTSTGIAAMSRPPARDSAAALAAKTGIRRPVDDRVSGREDDDLIEGRERRRFPVMTAVVMLFLGLLTGAIFAGYRYTQGQYFLAAKNGQVAVFRGISQKVLGISLSSPKSSTNISLSGLPAADVKLVTDGRSGSQTQIDEVVANIRKDYTTCGSDYAAIVKWKRDKPAPIRHTVVRNGKKVIETVQPPYPPEPSIPVQCPQATLVS